eukprot:scaffold20419_cov86-Skeletonema_dohrnii-CCMP3373.AAC.1
MLEPCKRCFYTIMANFNGSLKAVDCHIHSVRYGMKLESRAGSRLRCLIRSPTTLYGSDADTTNQCLSHAKDASILSWPTLMGH